jgi:hypothetical protein
LRKQLIYIKKNEIRHNLDQYYYIFLDFKFLDLNEINYLNII